MIDPGIRQTKMGSPGRSFARGRVARGTLVIDLFRENEVEGVAPVLPDYPQAARHGGAIPDQSGPPADRIRGRCLFWSNRMALKRPAAVRTLQGLPVNLDERGSCVRR